MTLTTTLNRIRAQRPCAEGWTKLLAGLGKTAPDDEPLSYATIARINGLDDALWCCQVEPRYDKHWRLFAIWCARQVEHLMEDQRSRNALDVAERHANGEANDAELDAAWVAAMTAARDARASARDAAWVTARDAAMVYARDAAMVYARDAARVSAWAAAMTVQMIAAGDAQLACFIAMCEQSAEDKVEGLITKTGESPCHPAKRLRSHADSDPSHPLF